MKENEPILDKVLDTAIGWGCMILICSVALWICTLELP